MRVANWTNCLDESAMPRAMLQTRARRCCCTRQSEDWPLRDVVGDYAERLFLFMEHYKQLGKYFTNVN